MEHRQTIEFLCSLVVLLVGVAGFIWIAFTGPIDFKNKQASDDNPLAIRILILAISCLLTHLAIELIRGIL